MTDAPRGGAPNVLCCPTCGHPKPEVALADLPYLGWPACRNPNCVAYGEPMASSRYRTRGDLRDDGLLAGGGT